LKLNGGSHAICLAIPRCSLCADGHADDRLTFITRYENSSRNKYDVDL